MDTQPENGAPAPSPAALDDVMARWALHEQREAQLQPANKTALLSALAAAGIMKVVIRFDGSGDSGQIEEIEAFDAEDIALEIPTTSVELLDLPWNESVGRPVSLALGAALEAQAYRLLGATHPGWENGDGAYGEFTFDVPAGTIRLEHADRYIATDDYSHEF
ncbi:MAG: hypothetical protein C0494_05895 [Sphingobium sp.]|nr:hypothetical protein [Sphingobium sp.]